MPETLALIAGRYALKREIGRGGMATLYLADDRRLGRQVAIKVLTEEESRRPRAIERFQREAQAAAALSHPNVVAVYDWGRAEDEQAYLVMEYVDGPDLRQVLRERGPLPADLVVQLAEQILVALEVAHEHGIVHRDVKPRNILLDRTGTAKLADFGIAGSTDDEDEDEDADEVRYGSALYGSPEQVQGKSVDARSDLYSLGVLLYELLTGAPPFSGSTPGDVAGQHIRAVPPAMSGVRPALAQVVLRALEKDPGRRFQSASDMRRALAGTTYESPTTPLTVPAPVRRAAPKKRPPIYLLPVLALSLLALLAWPVWLVLGQSSVPQVAGMPLEQARQVASDAGFGFETEPQATLDTPAGVIVSQQPEGRARAGTTIHAVVSAGMSVPDLSGQQCADARARLARSSWTVKAVRWRFANTPDFGKIVAQDPAPGTVVRQAGEISVQVAGPVQPC